MCENSFAKEKRHPLNKPCISRWTMAIIMIKVKQ